MHKRWVRSDNFDLNLGESEIFSEETLAMLSRNETLKEKLSDPLVQKLLSKLDNSRDRRYTFSKLYDSNDVFRSVIDEIASLVEFSPDP